MVNKINFEDPKNLAHRTNFDNLTPLYPNERLRLEIELDDKKETASNASIMSDKFFI